MYESGQCTDCTEGMYCNGFALTAPSGLCKQGYYCPTGSEVWTQIVCPIGQHCPEGSSEPVDCLPGSYTDYEGAYECIECPERFYCVPDLTTPGDISTVLQSCPEGFFCPNGTHYNWQPCPSGTFSDVKELKEASECMPCTGGQYCEGVNNTAPTGPCWPGYYCSSGADRPNPLMLNDSQCPEGTTHPIIGHACPTGHFCKEGTIYPDPCPAGTFQVSST